MKTRVVLALMLLALFLSGAGIVNAERLDTLARQSGDEAPTCLGQRLVGDFDYQILPDSSSLGMNGDAVQSVICNYSMSTRAAHPAGPGQIPAWQSQSTTHAPPRPSRVGKAEPVTGPMPFRAHPIPYSCEKRASLAVSQEITRSRKRCSC